MLKNKKGFTIIELIVTISIVAVVGFFIASIVAPAFNFFGASSEKSRVMMICNSVAVSVKEEVEMAQSVTIGNTSDDVQKPYIKTGSGKEIYICKEGSSEEALFDSSFFSGFSINIEFSKEDFQDYKNSSANVLFMKIEAVNADGKIIETMYTSIALPNLKGSIGGIKKGGAISYRTA